MPVSKSKSKSPKSAAAPAAPTAPTPPMLSERSSESSASVNGSASSTSKDSTSSSLDSIGMYRTRPQFQLPEQIPLPDELMYKVKPFIDENEVRSPSGSFSVLDNGSKGISPKDSVSAPETVVRSAKSKSPKSKSEHPAPEATITVSKSSDIKQKSSSSKSTDFLISEERVRALETRQLEIIRKLKELHDVVTYLHETIITEPGAGTKAASGTNQDDYDNSMDIVINANPTQPPYSLLFFYKLFAEIYGAGGIIFKTFTHSSIREPVKINWFEENQGGTNDFNGNESTISVSLIWKNISHDAELIVNPITGTEILGEDNICRFLSRLLPTSRAPLNYDTLDWNNLERVDAFLRNEIKLSHLESYLGTTTYLLEVGPTIADFGVFSALVRSGVKLGNSFPNVKKWINTMEKYGGFNIVEKTIGINK